MNDNFLYCEINCDVINKHNSQEDSKFTEDIRLTLAEMLYTSPNYN